MKPFIVGIRAGYRASAAARSGRSPRADAGAFSGAFARQDAGRLHFIPGFRLFIASRWQAPPPADKLRSIEGADRSRDLNKANGEAHMNAFIENYAHLVAISVPLLTLGAMNLLLALGGERGTLLLPTSGVFGHRMQALAFNTLPAAKPPQKPPQPANDPDFRRVA
jgi:hypothetical protein